MVAIDSSYPFSKLPATNGGSASPTFCRPNVTVVLLSHHFQLLQLYSAVDTGTTFFSLPSFIFTFFPPSFAKPGTSGAAGGGRLNVAPSRPFRKGTTMATREPPATPPGSRCFPHRPILSTHQVQTILRAP